MLFTPQVIVAFGIITIHEYFCFGIPGNRGLILGIWNPARIATITEIPRAQASYFTNVSTSLNPPNVQITSITSDEKNKNVFFAVQNSIYVFQKFNIWQNESKSITLSLAYKGKSAAFGQISFDFVSNNLYWCDSLLNWIAMKPAYGHNDSIHRIIVQDDLYQPEGLALDPDDGLMFFSDNDLNPRIEKTSMDGKNRTVIVHTSLIRILALSVDTVNDLLYWADNGRQTVEVSHFDGSNRRVLRRNNQVSLTGIHYHQSILHAASAGSKNIFGFDVTSGSVLYKLTMASAQPFAVHVYDAETPISYYAPCSSRGCQHMCVNTPAGPTCLCAEGYQLSTDGSTCTDPSWFHNKGFIVSNATAFSMLEANSVNGRLEQIYVLNVPFSFIETFAVDAETDLIYFVDSINNTLKELNIISRKIKTLASTENARDLNFDWIANLLEWIEPAQSTIRAYSINLGTTSVIYSGLQQPTSLTVDSHNGYLFWLSGRTQISIMRGTLSRSQPETIVASANTHNPSSLFYDVTSNRIYWVDRSIIKSCMTNGSDTKSHVITLGATQAFVYKDFFGWINADKIYFTRKTSISQETTLNIIQNASHVSIFDSSLETDRRGGCHILNGGCKDICVPLETGRKCECDIGLQLQSDLKTCDSSAYSTNFLLVSDYSHGRILQVDINTGNIVKLPIVVKTPPGMTFDKLRMKLIYSALSSKTIMSTTLHGKNTSLVYATGFAHAERLTIDYSTGNIYFTAEGSTPNQSYIGVIHRAALLHRTLFSNLHSPRDIVVYPSKGFLYWTEFGNKTEIGRSYMDGTSKEYIATTDIGWPNGLAIDFVSNRLYWTDGLKNRIEYSDLNGLNRHVLTTDNDAHLMSVVIHGQFLYYTAWNRQRITKINKATGSKVTFMTNHPELGRLDSLDIFTGDSVDVNRICSKNNGGCSTFCFPTPTGRTCGCQDNVNLQPDQKTCQGVSRCETSLQNVNFPDCLPYSGQTCPVACKSGYKLVSNTSVTCDQSGQWTPSPNPFCMEIFCTSAIDNALFSPECTRKAGESCTFSCNNGFTQTTSENLLCTSNGTWNMDTKNLCLRSGCSKTIKNGNFINCRSRIGETCRYECTSPFKVNPSVLNVTCNKSGDWSHDTNNLCVRLCSSSIQNGRLDRGCERKIGNICSYTCDPNYRPSIPSSKIVCTMDGAWNENTGEICKPSGCSKAIRNGQLINCQSHIQETCQYRCFSPLEINPSVPNITCKKNGTWSDDTNNLCVHLCPSTIRNGKLDESCIRNIGNICSYSCDVNYRPSLSSPNIVCTSGSTWNENTDGLCKPSGCSKTIQNGKLINCQANIRETCRYECSALFEVNPLAQNVTCNENGEWSHDVKDLCFRACSSFIRNGKLDKGCQRKIGNICSFSCDNNYSSSLHSSRIVCTSNGTWNENTNELCKRSTCSKTMKNGQFINCQSRIGETCQYECHGLLNVNPSVPNVTCNENGQWSHDTNNLCVRLCSSTIQSGKLDRGCQRKIGSICFYTCDPNFRSSVRSSRIVCTLNGTWNTNTDELCKPVECSKKIRNGELLNCQSNIQETCQYRCFSPLEINPSVPNITCKENGTWSDDTNNLCVHLCPSTIRNGKLDEDCQRNIGNICTYSCDVSYRSSLSSSSIVCTSGATWNENTDGLCKPSGCSKTIQNGKLIHCQSNIRESCRYECSGLFEVNSLAQNVTCYENGEWSHDVKDLCIRACPSIIRNGKLDKDCQRQIGNICSFSCDINYSSSLHSANIICTSNGTWNENTSELCKPSGCTKTIQNGKLVNCSSISGEICRYECIDHFYINPLIPTITCKVGGEWNHETNNLCVRLCSSIIPHGKIAPSCQRKRGDSCSFICDSNYQSWISSTSIVCTSASTWNENINTICKRITCPLQIPDGYLSSHCNGNIGEICEVVCRNQSNATSVQLICTSTGSWNKDINNICTQFTRNISSHHVTGNSFETYVFIGAAVAGFLIIAIVVTVCFLKKRHSNGYKYAQAQDEPQEMFLNPLYNLK